MWWKDNLSDLLENWANNSEYKEWFPEDEDSLMRVISEFDNKLAKLVLPQEENNDLNIENWVLVASIDKAIVAALALCAKNKACKKTVEEIIESVT